MYCPNCGKVIPDSSKWCQYCGQGTNNHNNASSRSFKTDAEQKISTQDDKPKILLNIASVLIPLVGWILWYVQKETKHKSAKTYSTLAWIGFVLNLLAMVYA